MSKSCKIRALPGKALICHNPSMISQFGVGFSLKEIKMLFTRKSILFYPRNLKGINEAILSFFLLYSLNKASLFIASG